MGRQPRVRSAKPSAFPFSALRGAAVVGIWLIAACANAAGGLASAILQANPNILMADGRSKAIVTATLDDGTQRVVPDGTQVHFSTSSGTLDPVTAISTGGVARTTLTSSPIAGDATVTASFITSTGGASGSIFVEFTTDATLANTDQVAANWIRVTSSDYLAYAADSRTLDCVGANQKVRISFRGLEIDADAAQVDLDADVVRAHSATLHHGSAQALTVDTMIYYLDSHTGAGIILNPPGRRMVEQVAINGLTLTTTEIPPSPTAPVIDYDFRDLSAGHVLVRAAAVSVQPHEQVQLARATIYLDGKRIVSMPNQVMPLATDQVFGQQVLGFGSDGLYLDVPYYASLTPTTTGLFSLRSPAAAIQSGTYFSGRRTLALDFDRTYQGANRQSDFRLDGISSSQWGASWTQSMRLAGGTQTYIYIDAPEHASYFSSADLRHDYGAVTAALDVTQSRPLSASQGSFTNSLSSDLQTPAHLLFGDRAHGLFYVENTAYNSAQNSYRFSNATLDTTSITESAGMTFNTSPYVPDRRTTITDSFSLLKTVSPTSHFSALTMNGNLQMMSRLSSYSDTTLGYQYTHDPQLGTPIPVVVGDKLIALANSSDKNNFTLAFDARTPNNLWYFTLNSSYGLPTQDVTAGGTLSFRLSSQMRLEMDDYFSEEAGYSFHDTDFAIAHRIGARDLVVSWDSLIHSWLFNLVQAQF